MPPVNGAFCVTLMKDRCINVRMPGKCATCFEVCPPKFDAVRKIIGEPVPPPLPEEERTIVRKKKKKKASLEAS